jgi:RNA polymerase sigma-70 factor, ECF subfamily
MDRTDQQLIDLAREGDNQALRDLIVRYSTPVYNLAYRFARNQADAEDITQDVFIKVWRKMYTYDEEKSFKTWVLAIARNASLDWLKKRRPVAFSAINRDNQLPIEDTIEDAEPLADAELDALLRRSYIKKAAEELSPDYQAVLTLRHNENLTFQEIALVMNESIDTIKSRYRRAIGLLKKRLPPDL